MLLISLPLQSPLTSTIMLPDMAFLLSGWLRTRCAIPDSFICRSTPPPLYWPRRAATSSREGRGALW